MKVLLTGPNIQDKNRLGGIITVVNTILALFPEMEYFARSGKQGLGLTASLRGFAGIVRSYSKRLRKGDVDLVHINTAFERSALVRDLIFVQIAAWNKIPVVLHIHGGKYLTYSPDAVTRQLISLMLKNSREVVVLGKKEKAALSELFPSEHIHILMNSLDFSRIPKPLPKFSGPLPVLVYLGRIDENKGLQDILQALILLKEKKRSFIYRVYGNGPLEKKYVAQCHELLGDNFEYGGVVHGDGKWDALNLSDVFLLPSLYEGLPMSLLEAMAVGVLCVTTRVGSIPEVITPGANGCFVNKEDPRDLLDTIETILDTPAEYLALAENGRQTVKERFNGEVYRKSLLNIYHGTIV